MNGRATLTRMGVLCAAALIFAGAAWLFAAENGVETPVPGPAPGEAVNGLKLTVTADGTELRMKARQLRRATEDTPRYDVMPVKLSFTFTNVSDKPIKLDTYLLTWHRLRLDVQGPAAGSVRTRDMGPFMGAPAPPTEKDYPTIDPGKSWDTDIPFPGMFGTKEYTLMQPGDYRVRATYTCGEAAAYARFSIGCWTGSVTSNEIVLKGVAVKAE